MTSITSWLTEAAGAVGQAAAYHRPSSEADLALPNFSTGVKYLGMSGWSILAIGLVVCAIGLAFGMSIFMRLKNAPVHKAMLEVSELIYATCKAYLKTQVKFIAMLWVFIATVIIVYFAALEHAPIGKVLAIAGFTIVGIAGSVAVAAFGIRVNTFANSRAAFASLRGKPYPTHAIPMQAGMSIGTMLISVELLLLLAIFLFMPGDYAGPCFIGFAVGESLGAAALRIAGGIFTKIADIGADLMKIVFNIKEDDARNPGVIADCTGDNAGDSVGPTADGFETYGVTAVALITFVLVAIPSVGLGAVIQQVLLVWMFVNAFVMILGSIISYLINAAYTKSKYQNADSMDFEKPLTTLVWLTSFVCIGLTFLVAYLVIGQGDAARVLDQAVYTATHAGEVATYPASGLWWKLASIISCGTLAGAVIPEVIKVFTSVNSGHVKEVVKASEEGGASLNILAGLTAGNFSAYWMGLVIAALMGVAYMISTLPGIADVLITINLQAGLELSGPAALAAAAVFAFGLVAFGFLSMGPVTIAVDSYGPVTDNAQSVYELSLIEDIPDIATEIKKDFGFEPNFEQGKYLLEENDGAGNTFKATSKPVLIGTAVVGATTMIFALIMLITKGLRPDLVANLSMINPPFLLGLIVGGAVIYWFSGAATQAVATGAYRAVEFIKANIKLDNTPGAKASVEDSKKVVEICTVYAQKGTVNIFFALFFCTLSFACIDEYFFIAYLLSLALFGLFQALFMANAGGAWDNAKKIVEVNMKAKGTPLHAACVVGDTVGDPFKDTSSVALNPVIKFSTLFGIIAVGLALKIKGPEIDGGLNMPWLNVVIAAVAGVISMVFVYRSFYGMRIGNVETK